MNLTVTLETAKRMEELGWSKRSYFSSQDDIMENRVGLGTSYGDDYCMPTAQEILDELPKVNGFILEMLYFGKGGYLVGYKENEGLNHPIENYEVESDTLSEALAHLRIRCKENGHIK